MKTTTFNDGTPIQKVEDFFSWGNMVTPAYCWYDNDSLTNKKDYGAMYNWYSATSDKLCPLGWRVPTDADWTELTDFLGGLSSASAKLKESGTNHWNSPNDESTNSSRFTALPGGYRSYADGKFFSKGDNGSWWTSTQDPIFGGIMRAMTNYETSDVRVISAYYGYGMSVRCIKN